MIPVQMRPLPLGSIRPTGWLRDQLRLQSDGLTGGMEDHWECLGPGNCWLGGAVETWETYERGPYYVDGLIPLAFALGDEKLIDRAKKWMDWSLESQRSDGRFGPPGLTDWWPWTPMLKAMVQWEEATGDPRVVPCLARFFDWMSAELHRTRLWSWAAYRWMDAAWIGWWLGNRTNQRAPLQVALELMSQGYSWTHHFAEFALTQKQALSFSMASHVVNNAMGVKAPGVAYLLTGREEHLRTAIEAPEVLDKFHGTATGVFTGDEHLAGRDPNQGTELCAVVELMFSLECLVAWTGEARFADRLERVAYNALPATFDPMMRAHQYDQQANQVLCTNARRDWTNNGDDANLFGLEPHYGCCTADMHQGWPKFVANLWMATRDGLAAVAYGPCAVTAEVSGTPVSLAVETNYPFEDAIRIEVRPDLPATFPIRLRIPEWVSSARTKARGETREWPAGGWAELNGEWSGDTIELELLSPVLAEKRFRGATSLRRGPLTFVLPVGEDWRRVGGPDAFPLYEVHPATPWNYGLAPDAAARATFSIREPSSPVFAADRAPVTLTVPGRRVPQWTMAGASAGTLPHSPVFSGEPVQSLELVPYGCAKLRITEFPTLDA